MTDSPRELDDVVSRDLSTLCAEGDELADNGRFREALARYDAAWNLIPEPKHEWTASMWVLAAIADAAYLGGFPKSARDALDYVMHCPDAMGNPFLHLRRGQVLYDGGDSDGAADELMRAYMGGGEEIFANEDPRYLAFLATRARL